MNTPVSSSRSPDLESAQSAVERPFEALSPLAQPAAEHPFEALPRAPEASVAAAYIRLVVGILTFIVGACIAQYSTIAVQWEIVGVTAVAVVLVLVALRRHSRHRSFFAAIGSPRAVLGFANTWIGLLLIYSAFPEGVSWEAAMLFSWGSAVASLSLALSAKLQLPGWLVLVAGTVSALGWFAVAVEELLDGPDLTTIIPVMLGLLQLSSVLMWRRASRRAASPPSVQTQ